MLTPSEPLDGLRVVLGADAIQPPLTGIGHYALQLARGLRAHPAVADIRYFAAHRWLDDPEQALVAHQVIAGARRWLPFKSLAVVLYTELQQRLWGRRLNRLARCVVHAPNYIAPPCNQPTVATVHDLSHLHYPQFHPRERVRYLERYLPRTLARASRLITVSEFVRGELISLLGVSPERVVAVHNGVDPAFRPYATVDIQPTLSRYGLQSSAYWLAVATLEPRKNLGRLADAFSRLPVALRSRYPLILVGARGWLTETLEQQLSPLEAQGQIRRLGYVPQADLPLLYAGAHAFAYPSLYEGFGLPVLEAMACGTPVLTADSSSLPEVAGDAALLVQPEDVEAITFGLQQLLNDNEWRAVARVKGLQRAAGFSWARCVEETIAVYRQAWAG